MAKYITKNIIDESTLQAETKKEIRFLFFLRRTAHFLRIIREQPENTLHLLRFVNWLHSLLLDRPILPHPYYKTGRINNCYLLLALTLWSISSPKASHRINEIYHILYHYHSFRHQVLQDKNQICFLCFYLDLILNILNVSLA